MLPHLENRLAVTSLVDPYLRLNSALDAKQLHLFALIAAHCLQVSGAPHWCDCTSVVVCW